MEIKAGDFVVISGQETVGEVLAVRGNDVEVALGLMKINVKKNKLTIVDAPEEEYEEESDGQYANSGIDTREKMLNFKYELDVRGKMKDEVINELTSWVDDAILLGVKEASIMHGRGTGVIKDTVRAFLKKYNDVESVVDAPREKGGEGVSLVKFRV